MTVDWSSGDAFVPRDSWIGTATALEVRDLNKSYSLRPRSIFAKAGRVGAVQDVSFDIRRGEILGIVGESGSGKSTLARLILGLEEPDSGSIRYNGRAIARMKGSELQTYRRSVQLVLQNPYGALDPHMRVYDAIAEPGRIHGVSGTSGEEKRRVEEALDLVNLGGGFCKRFPDQLSGGQRQRVVIARALALRPEVLICDEPVSALDVLVQAQILNLIKDIRDQLGLACLFIGHDLSVIRQVSDRVIVMYGGRIVESAETERLFTRPAHPYSRDLVSSVPTLPGMRRPLGQRLVGSDWQDATSGCAYAPRCPFASPKCWEVSPMLSHVEPNHGAACHHPQGELQWI